MKQENHFDIAVIGGGVTGCWIAYELSKFACSVCIIEKENDIAMGSTKANSAIVHAGYDPVPGSMMAKMNVRGNEIIRNIHSDMDIPFKQPGSYVLAFSDQETETLKALKKRGEQNGVTGLVIEDGDSIRKKEPHVSDAVKAGLFAPTGGLIDPFELCAAPCELAITNGAELIRNFNVEKIEFENENIIISSDTGKYVKAGLIINAAGVHADEIAALCGDNSFSITPRRGEYSVLDNSFGYLTGTILFQTPTEAGKGILVLPTVDGNILVGPTAEVIDDKENKDTTSEGQKKAFDTARKTVPEVKENMIINSFSGIRPTGSTRDFIIGFSEYNGRLYNAAAIESPGLTSAPAIGEYVARELYEKGFTGEKKKAYSDKRTIVRMKELSDDEKNMRIKENPKYGRIICRCETISEGEIVDAVLRPAGARDVDGVKRRVRAGMGRCQGGFCAPKVIEILSRELSVSPIEITKFGKASNMLSEPMDSEVEYEG